MSSIPPGWMLQPDGSYSKPSTVQFATYGDGTILSSELANVYTPKKKIRLRQDNKPLMNGLEGEYWQILCNLFGKDLVKPQALRFRIGNGIWFKPDFTVFASWTDDTEKIKPIRCYEVKGPHAFRGGFENLKVAANQWPQIQLILVWKESGQWKEQLILQ